MAGCEGRISSVRRITRMDPPALQPRREPTPPAATVELAPTHEEASGETTDRRVEVVEGSGPHLTAETRSFLQARLRAAAIVLLIAFSLFLARSLFSLLLGSEISPDDLTLLLFHLAVTIALATSVLALSGRRSLSLRGSGHWRSRSSGSRWRSRRCCSTWSCSLASGAGTR